MKQYGSFLMASVLLSGMALFPACSDDKPEPEPALSAWDASNMDLSVKPGDDFYRYAVGGWMKANEGKQRMDLSDEELDRVKDEVIEELIAGGSDKYTAIRLAHECMMSAEKRDAGMDEISYIIQTFGELKTRAEVVAYALELAQEGYLLLWNTELYREEDGWGNIVLASCAVSSVVDYDDEGETGLYRATMERVLGMAGLEEGEARRLAASALAAERDVKRHSVGEWSGEGYFWAYMEGLGVDYDTRYNDSGFAGIEYALNEMPLESLRDYLAWSAISMNAGFLSGEMLEEYSAFRVALSERGFSMEGIARQHVETFYREEIAGGVIERMARPGMLETYEAMAREIVAVARERIAGADWIQDASTREEALRKLDNMEIYLMGKRVSTRGSSFWTSALECQAVARKSARESVLARRGTYVSKQDMQFGWNELATNAYYASDLNLFNVCAGIMTEVGVSRMDDEAFLYGYLGTIMGHELMHAFDNNGRQFDSDGGWRDWWTPGDAARFEERARRVSEYYSTLTYEGYAVNGEQVLGECISDLGGVSIAYEAMKRVTGGAELRDADGFTAAQRFFFGFAWFFADGSPERDADISQTDEHVYPPLRVVSVYANTDGWYEAFPEVQPGDKWYIAPGERLKVW